MRKIIFFSLLLQYLFLSNSLGLEEIQLDRSEFKHFEQLPEKEYFVELIVRKGKSLGINIGHAYIIWKIKDNSEVIEKDLFMSSLLDPNKSNFFIDSENDQNKCKFKRPLNYTSTSSSFRNGYIVYRCETQEAFGFYPLECPVQPVFGALKSDPPSQPTVSWEIVTVHGGLKDEFKETNTNEYETTHKLVVKVNALKFYKSRLVLLEWQLSHDKYRLLNIDCVTFSNEIANAIGIITPERNEIANAIGIITPEREDNNIMRPEEWIKRIIELNKPTSINNIIVQ